MNMISINEIEFFIDFEIVDSTIIIKIPFASKDGANKFIRNNIKTT